MIPIFLPPLSVLRLPDVGEEPGLRGVHPGLEEVEQVLHLEAGPHLVVHQLHDVGLGQRQEPAAVDFLQRGIKAIVTQN